MKSKTVILMVVAIGCGLVASYMTSRVIADRQGSEVQEEKVAVLVAKQNLALGTFIKEPEKLFEERQYILGQEPKKAIKDFAQLKQQRLNKPLNAESFVTPEDLVSKEQDGIASLMQKGMRGYAIKVSAESSAGGFILPSSRVDIVSVVRRENEVPIAKILLQNVNVLAVDAMAGRTEDKMNIVGATVTVEVTPKQAEQLTIASELGSLRLILRSFGDDAKVQTRGVSSKNILQGSDSKGDDNDNANGGEDLAAWTPKVPEVKEKKPELVVEKTPEPPAQKTHTLMIYNGDQVTKAVYLTASTEGEWTSSLPTVNKSQPTVPVAQNQPQEQPKLPDLKPLTKLFGQ